MTSLAETVRTARLQALADAIDAHPTLPGRLQFYSGARPTPGEAAGGSLQGVVILNRPCASVAAAVLSWDVTPVAEGQRTSDLDIAWVRCLDGYGAFVFDCDVGLNPDTNPAADPDLFTKPILLDKLDGYTGSFLRLTSGGFIEPVVNP